MKQREIQARAQATNQDRRDAPSFTHCLARPLMAPSMPDVPRSSSSTSTHTTSPATSTTHSMDGMEEMSRQPAARIDGREQKRHHMDQAREPRCHRGLHAGAVAAGSFDRRSSSQVREARLMVPNSRPPSSSPSPRLDTDRVGFGVGGGGLKSSSGGGRSSRHGLRRDPDTDQCAFIESGACNTDGRIDYLHFYYCTMEHLHWLAIILFVRSSLDQLVRASRERSSSSASS